MSKTGKIVGAVVASAAVVGAVAVVVKKLRDADKYPLSDDFCDDSFDDVEEFEFEDDDDIFDTDEVKLDEDKKDVNLQDEMFKQICGVDIDEAIIAILSVDTKNIYSEEELRKMSHEDIAEIYASIQVK